MSDYRRAPCETATWRPIVYAGKTYDLAHLNSRVVSYEIQAKGTQPARSYLADVLFSPHCFTRGLPKNEPHDRQLEYRDGRELRLFDEERWTLSFQLPEIITELPDRRCQFGTGHQQNFLTVELVTDSGEPVDYSVFFTVTRSSSKGRLNLFVQSAYLRAIRPNTRSVRFEVILAKALEGRKPRE